MTKETKSVSERWYEEGYTQGEFDIKFKVMQFAQRFFKSKRLGKKMYEDFRDKLYQVKI